MESSEPFFRSKFDAINLLLVLQDNMLRFIYTFFTWLKVGLMSSFVHFMYVIESGY